MMLQSFDSPDGESGGTADVKVLGAKIMNLCEV